MLKLKYRSEQAEIMDDFHMKGAEIEHALEKIAWINKFLGGNKITVDAVRKIAQQHRGIEPLYILDIGCGNGDMLRTLAIIGEQQQYNFILEGVDANPHTIAHAQQLSKDAANISYRCGDVLNGFETKPVDITLLTLTLHHFSDDQIGDIIATAMTYTRRAIIINDLQRNRLSYLLFSWMCKIFNLGAMNTQDGKTSISRGFKRSELMRLAEKLNIKKHTIRWKWAFRYQWIITCI